MLYAALIVSAMALFAATAATAFAWAVASGQFGSPEQAAESIFWDEGGVPERAGEQADGL